MNLAIDLDGTLAGWGDERAGLGVGPWLPNAMRALTTIRQAGHIVVIHSCRVTWVEGGGIDAVAEFLRSGGFVPFVVRTDPEQREKWSWIAPDGEESPAEGDGVPWADSRAVGIWAGIGKPIAHAYIDDRGWAFNGSWDDLIETLFGGFAKMVEEQTAK